MRAAVEQRDAALTAVSADGLTSEFRVAYRDAYRWRARCLAAELRFEALGISLLLAGTFGPIVVLVVLLSQRADAVLSVVASLAGALVGTTVVLSLAMRFLSLYRVAFVLAPLGVVYLWWRDGWLDALAAKPWLAFVSGAFALPLLTLALVVALVFVEAWLAGRYARNQPRSVLFTGLIDLALALAEPGALQDQPAYLLRRLNSAATVLETGLWRKVRLVDPVSRTIWRDRCRQCAQYLRRLDLAIALPRQDTREYLQGEINSLIHVLLRGSLDELPTAEPRPRRRLAVFASAVRSLVLGLIPLAAVFGAQYLGLDLSGALGNTLLIGALAWFAVTVLTTFDAQAAARIALLKDAADAMGKFKSTRS